MKFFKCQFLTSPSPQLMFLLLPNPLTLLVCEKENLILSKKPTTGSFLKSSYSCVTLK